MLLFLSGCAAGSGTTGSTGSPATSGSCVHDVARSWVITSISETINLSQNCTGYTVVCGMQFTYTKPNASGQTTINVISTNGNSGCYPPGVYNCTMTLSGYSHGKYNFMALNCGAGDTIYVAD